MRKMPQKTEPAWTASGISGTPAAGCPPRGRVDGLGRLDVVEELVDQEPGQEDPHERLPASVALGVDQAREHDQVEQGLGVLAVVEGAGPEREDDRQDAGQARRLHRPLRNDDLFFHVSNLHWHGYCFFSSPLSRPKVLNDLTTLADTALISPLRPPASA